jgi:O-antigen ligase
MGTGFFYILPAAQDAIHTMYAEVALGTGIGGLIAYLLFLGLCLVYCWKSLRFAHSDYAWIIISGVVVIVALFVGGAGIAPAKRFSVNILHWFIVSLAMAAAQASQRPAKVS